MHRDRLFTAAYLATADARAAMALVQDVVNSPAEPTPAATPLAKLIQRLEMQLPRCYPEFAEWDRVLRSDVTTASFEPKHEEARETYLWELKRQCLANTLQCLSVASRLAFIVVDVLQAGVHDATQVLGISRKALQVRMQRAQWALENYLEPRCGHLNQANPCSCRGRLGIAIREDVIRLPVILAAPATPHDARARSVPSLYRGLVLEFPGSA